MEDSQLNPRQIEFVRRYIESGNGTKAYMEVYQEASEETAASNASRLLRNDKVQSLINEYRKQLDRVSRITAEQIMLHTANIASSAPKISDRLRALDMLAKMKGMYVQRMEIEGAGGLIVNVFPATLNPEKQPHDESEQHCD